MRQVIAGLQIPIAWRRGPPMPAEERAVRLDLAEALHLPNRDVSQLLSGANAFPHRLRWNAEVKGRSYLILCNDSSYACHYLFDSFDREKVVPSAVGAGLLNNVPDFGGSTSNSHRDVGDADAPTQLRRQHKAQPLGTGRGDSIEVLARVRRQWAAARIGVDHDSPADGAQRCRKT